MTRKLAGEGMRLGTKTLLTSLLLIAILVGVAGWSLLAMHRLVTVTRGTLVETLPAVQAAVALRESLLALARFEARYIVLGEPKYHDLWAQRAQRVAEELDRLALLVTTDEARARLAELRSIALTYHQLVERERQLVVRGHKDSAMLVYEQQSRRAVERAEAAAMGLKAAIENAAGRALARARELERRTWTGALAALVLSAGTAVGGSAWVAVRLTRSLRRLSAATREIAEGSFHEPVRVESRDETREVAEAFNQMAAQLREVEAMKEELFSTITHELRNPLTSILLATRLVADGGSGPLTPKQEQLLATIAKSAKRVLRLSTQILDLSQLGAGVPLPLGRRPVDLTQLAQQALDEVRPQAEGKGVELAREGTTAAIEILGDEERLLQILVNLLVNAVKFTPAGGSVTLAIVEGEAEVEVAVTDTGPGIPAQALRRIFDRYQQAHRGRGGSGLGLAIVKAFAEAHGGSVRAESEEGMGSRFIVVLPRDGARS